MDISLFLAQAFGLYMVLIGLAILLRPGSTVELLQTVAHRHVVFMSGFVSLILGVPLVLVHNIWDGSWRVLITVLAWMTLGKGVVNIYAPGRVASWADAWSTSPRLLRSVMWGVVLLGIYLLYLGFQWGG